MSKRVVGVGVLVAVGVIAGIVAWRVGIPGGGNPRAQLRQRLETPAARPGQTPDAKPASKPTPAAPVTTIRPSVPPVAAPPLTTTPPVIVPPVTAPPVVRPLVETLPPPSPAPPRVAIGVAPSVALPSITGAPPASPAMATPPSAPPLSMTPAPSTATAAPLEESARFALMFGPFASSVEAERLERTLIKAGHVTLRTRQGAGPTVYAVLIERVPTPHDARTIVSVLREQAIGEATIVSTEPVVVRVGDLHPLRGAVALAERVRKAGYQVRVAAQPSDKVAYVIRHGSFATREEAEARSRELARLSVPAAQVVPVR